MRRQRAGNGHSAGQAESHEPANTSVFHACVPPDPNRGSSDWIIEQKQSK
jgi:hypothetical protein